MSKQATYSIVNVRCTYMRFALLCVCGFAFSAFPYYFIPKNYANSCFPTLFWEKCYFFYKKHTKSYENRNNKWIWCVFSTKKIARRFLFMLFYVVI